MARRGWDSLSTDYRQRLQRGGITRTEYESGASLAKARGHVSPVHEQSQSRSYRNISRWVDRYAATYGGSDEEILYQGNYYTKEELHAEVLKHGRVEAEYAIRHQESMERLWNDGDTRIASAQYQLPRRRAYPDWMFYYHGIFS